MNVDWIIPCRFVEVHDNLGTLVGAGIDTFWLPELPAAVQVVMAVRLLGLPEELATDVQHRGRNVVRGPDGETVSDISGEFTIAGGEQARPDWLQGIIFPWSFSSRRPRLAPTCLSTSSTTQAHPCRSTSSKGVAPRSRATSRGVAVVLPVVLD